MLGPPEACCQLAHLVCPKGSDLAIVNFSAACRVVRGRVRGGIVKGALMAHALLTALFTTPSIAEQINDNGLDRL